MVASTSSRLGPIDDIIVSFLQSFDKNHFGTKDKILFFRELGYLLHGWVSLLDALQTLYQNSDNYAIKEITRTILWYLRKWKSLSYALNRLHDYFDPREIMLLSKQVRCQEIYHWFYNHLPMSMCM